MHPPHATLNLDGPWRFIPDPCRDGMSLGFWKSDTDDTAWLETTTPASFETAYPALGFFMGVCWYRHRFTVPPDWHGRRIVLTFGSVNDRAQVWLNGQLLGTNEDPFLPFSFAIDGAVLPDAMQVLTVQVDNQDQPGDVPGRHVGWRRQGGILREVTLTATDHRHISQARVNAEADGSLRLAIRVGDDVVSAKSLALRASVVDPAGQTCARLAAESIDHDLVELSATVPDVRRWSDREPFLYQVRIDLLDQQDLVDQLTIRCGFRSITATADGLLLNGEPLFLTGFNRHEDSPRTGMAADHPLSRQDLLAMQAAGANMVRLCHYPHHPQTLEWCDELGLLVFAEIPLYHWGNDIEHGRQHQSARIRTARRQLRRMIDRDGNHPSILFWSVSNETRENEPAVRAGNAELIALARSLDPSRLCVHVSNWWLSDPHFEDDDVICLNHYPSLGLTGRSAISTADLAEVTDDWRRNLQSVRQSYPTKPILITEFGYPSLAGTKGHAYGEDVQARVLAAEFAAFDLPYVCGATVWCWADHNWRPNTRLGLVISPFGVVTRDRHPLPALAVISSCFAERRRRDVAGIGDGPKDNG